MNEISNPAKVLPFNPQRTLELGRRICGSASKGDAVDVSVITVVFNNATTLQRCIDSVIAQQGVTVEYIVIDGGSTDGTLDVIRANAEHIDYAVSESDNGIYDAMNKGISLARGDYIALINSDDWLEPYGLKQSIDNIRANAAEVSIGFANVWDKHGKFSHIWKIGNFDARILTSGMSFCHQALIASRSAYDIVGLFDASIRISADYKWIKKLYLTGLKTVFTEQPVVNFSFDGLAANNRPVWKAECKTILYEAFPFLDKEDISAFLEYVYKDTALDQNAVTNLIMQAGDSPLLLQSLGLVLLDRLCALEIVNKNVVSAAKRRSLENPKRGVLSVAESVSVNIRPKISVIIPVYNVEDYLEICLRSVMEQSLRDIEIICVNDGSPDKSQTILERLAGEDCRIRIIEKNNGGLSSARNAGLKVANGEYIHFLDSDDYINPGMYATLYNYAEKNQLEIVKSNLGFIDNALPVKRPILPKNSVFTFEECPACVQFISPCSALYAKELFNRVSPFIEGMTYEDRFFNWDTLIEARRIGHVDKVFYMYRLGRPGSIMSLKNGSMRHYDAFKAIDHIRTLLQQKNILDKYKIEYVKEQLRVYSMLIDINAIPKQTYGSFYWSIHTRLNELPLSFEQIQGTNLPPRVKSLYAFFTGVTDNQSLRSEGERYFFHGLKYQATANRYGASSCELFMLAEYAVSNIFKAEPLTEKDIFRKATIIATLFDEIHNGTSINTVDELHLAISKINNLVFGSGFEPILALLHDLPRLGLHSKIEHLCFQASKAKNYEKCGALIRDFFSVRGKNFLLLEHKDIEPKRITSAMLAVLRETVSSIKAIGFRSFAFSQIVNLKLFLNHNLNIKNIQSLTVLFPNSAPETYLIEFLKSQCSIVFVPHGMPQIGLQQFTPNYVLTLSKGREWVSAFGSSRIAHVGWPEVINLPLTQGVVRKIDQKKVVLFLSQIEGSRVHKLDDFLDLTNRFIKVVVSQNLSDYVFNIRLRKESELDLLDAGLVREAKARSNIIFSSMLDGDLFHVRCDILVSATSTGMMYAQHMRIPCLQIVSERLLAHWPYLFSKEDDLLTIDELDSSLASVISRLLSGHSIPHFYDTLSADERYSILDGVYNVSIKNNIRLHAPRW